MTREPVLPKKSLSPSPLPDGSDQALTDAHSGYVARRQGRGRTPSVSRLPVAPALSECPDQAMSDALPASVGANGHGRTTTAPQGSCAVPDADGGGDQAGADTHPTGVSPADAAPQEMPVDDERTPENGYLRRLARWSEAVGEDEAKLWIVLAAAVETFWDIQKTRIGISNRLSALNRADIPIPVGLDDSLRETLKSLQKAEDQAERRASRTLKESIPPLALWVDKQPGVGVMTVARILACTGPLDRFSGVAKLWAYLGLDVREGQSPRRAKGERANWSTRGRTMALLLSKGVVKHNKGPWRRLFDDKKAEYLARPRSGLSGCPMGQEHWDKGHRHILACVKGEPGQESSAHLQAAAERYVAKEFLKALWVEWHRR